MYPYLIVFFLTSILALASFSNKSKPKSFFFFYVVAIGVFVGLSDMLGGYDRYIYAEVFTSNAEGIVEGDNEVYEKFFSKEPLFGLINTLIGFLTPNRYVFILLYTLIVYIVYAVCFYKYTEYPFFALLVFLGLMFFFTFTYLRQVLAAGIVWLSLPYYRDRKKWKYMGMILLAAMAHNSAAIMALLYFIPLKKRSFNAIMPVMLGLLVLGLIGVGQAFAIVGGLVGNSNISSHANVAEFGFRYEYVVESILFLIILYNNYSTVANDKETLSYLNLYLMFCGILLLFCKSSDGGRIAWYGIMGIIIMLTRFCKSGRGVPLRYGLVLMFFALFMRILLAWGILLSPYKTFLTDGVRDGDYIWEFYEYDHEYDKDKLYNL